MRWDTRRKYWTNWDKVSWHGIIWYAAVWWERLGGSSFLTHRCNRRQSRMRRTHWRCHPCCCTQPRWSRCPCFRRSPGRRRSWTWQSGRRWGLGRGKVYIVVWLVTQTEAPHLAFYKKSLFRVRKPASQWLESFKKKIIHHPLCRHWALTLCIPVLSSRRYSRRYRRSRSIRSRRIYSLDDIGGLGGERQEEAGDCHNKAQHLQGGNWVIFREEASD